MHPSAINVIFDIQRYCDDIDAADKARQTKVPVPPVTLQFFYDAKQGVGFVGHEAVPAAAPISHETCRISGTFADDSCLMTIPVTLAELDDASIRIETVPDDFNRAARNLTYS